MLYRILYRIKIIVRLHRMKEETIKETAKYIQTIKIKNSPCKHCLH